MPNEYGSMINQAQTAYMNQNINGNYQQYGGSPSKLTSAMSNMSLQNNQQSMKAQNYAAQNI